MPGLAAGGDAGMKRLGLLLLCVSMLSACGDADRALSQGSAAGAEVHENPRRQAPEFALETLDGETLRLSDLRGKIVVVDFWATWCAPCEFQVPALNDFWETHEAAGDVEVLGVSVDFEGPEVVAEWVEEKGVKYKVLLGGEDVARRFGAYGFPTLYVVAPDGFVASEHVGLIDMDDLEAAIARQREPESG